MTTFMRFTDHEGDPLALTNQISAVYVTREKDEVHSFMGREAVLTAVKDQYTVVNHATGNYRVRDTFDEVMAKIEMADAAETLANEPSVNGYL